MGLGGSKSTPAPAHVPAVEQEEQEVLAFCVKNHSDLPNIVDVLNNAGDGKYKVQLVDHEILTKETFNVSNPKLALVFALCGTDRVDIVDKELVDTLHATGYENVLMIILRRGNNPSAFRANIDTTINSGVGKDKVLLQLVHYKGEVMMDAENNKGNLERFVTLAKRALN